MRVQFDLRPSGMVERERKQTSFNFTRLLAVLLILLFFISSIGYIVMMTLNRFSMQEAVAAKESEVSGLESENLLLAEQMADLRARQTVFADALKIMQEDLPSLEVLDALQANMDTYGIRLKTVRFTPGMVEITGTIAGTVVDAVGTEEQRMRDFCEGLRGSGVFVSVPGAASTFDSRTNMLSFTLSMPVLTMDGIHASR